MGWNLVRWLIQIGTGAERAVRQVVVALMLCAQLLGARVEADERPATLLILSFNNATGEPGYAALEKGVPDLLSALFSPHAERVRLVERERLDLIVREQSLSWQQFVEVHSLGQIGKFVQADYILRGSFTRVGSKLQVQALVYETETTQLVTSAESNGDADDLVIVCRRLVDGMMRFFSAKTGKAPRFPVDEDPEKTALMIDGLGYFYSGQLHKAFPAFMKIIAKDPRDSPARYWLGRSFYEAGLADHATIELEDFLRLFPKHAKVAEVKQLLEAIRNRGGKSNEK